jgi:hypothetical protein
MITQVAANFQHWKSGRTHDKAPKIPNSHDSMDCLGGTSYPETIDFPMNIGFPVICPIIFPKESTSSRRRMQVIILSCVRTQGQDVFRLRFGCHWVDYIYIYTSKLYIYMCYIYMYINVIYNYK